MKSVVKTPVVPFGGYGTTADPNRNPFSRNIYPVVFFEADPTPGNNPPVNDPAPKPTKAEIDAAVDARIAQLLGAKSVNNDPIAALTVVVKQNHALETENTRLKNSSGQLPDDVKAKVAYVDELGGVDKLKKRVSDGDAAIESNAKNESEKAMRAACEAAGLDYADFSTRKGVDEVAYEIKTEKRDNKDTPVAYVSFEQDGKQQSKPLSDWATERFPTVAKAGAQQRTGVTPYGKSAPAQSGQPQKTLAERIREEEAAKKKNTVTAGDGGEQKQKPNLEDRFGMTRST